MIAYLKGTILIKKAKHLILAVNNIGYRVFVGERALNGLKEGSEASLYIHHHVTENSQIGERGIAAPEEKAEKERSREDLNGAFLHTRRNLSRKKWLRQREEPENPS